MKNLKQATMIAAFILSCSFAMAQEETTGVQPRPAKWLSDKGYWVIESNVKTPKSSVVHFYNPANQLLSSVKVEGKKLNPARRKTLKNLKKALEEAADANTLANTPAKQEELVAILNGKK
ncbi:hypothetical protein [Ferruginibacter sp.]